MRKSCFIALIVSIIFNLLLGALLVDLHMKLGRVSDFAALLSVVLIKTQNELPSGNLKNAKEMVRAALEASNQGKVDLGLDGDGWRQFDFYSNGKVW